MHPTRDAAQAICTMLDARPGYEHLRHCPEQTPRGWVVAEHVNWAEFLSCERNSAELAQLGLSTPTFGV